MKIEQNLSQKIIHEDKRSIGRWKDTQDREKIPHRGISMNIGSFIETI